MVYEPKPGMSVEELDTPTLLLDLEAFQRNVTKMAAFFADKPAELRPHAKSHKCPEVAHRQIKAGAIGITCAKVSEAEVMAGAGVSDILVANQVVGAIKIDRLTDLAARCNLMVAVDDPTNVQDLATACGAKGVTLGVLVEVDTGMKRCGVQTGEDALELARLVVDAPNLTFEGLQGYEGHLVHVLDRGNRAAGVREAMGLLQATKALIELSGIPVLTVSGGGTGTYDLSGSVPPMTEIQAGSYVFMDAKYIQVRPEFEPALTVLSTVLSRPIPGRIITDAGLKTMPPDFGWPKLLDHAAEVVGLSEEHAKLMAEDPGAVTLQPGDRVRFIPSHCCTTVNLHDRLYVVRDGVLVDIWPIAARGCAQ
jgi:D-serine deaminase-like pyridoxal phosphate-dependent protein